MCCDEFASDPIRVSHLSLIEEGFGLRKLGIGLTRSEGPNGRLASARKVGWLGGVGWSLSLRNAQKQVEGADVYI